MAMTEEERAAALAAIRADPSYAQSIAAQQAEDMNSPDYWTGVAARARALPSKLLAGGSAAVNTAFYGIPDVILKAASSDAYKKLQDLRAASPGATLLGTGAGLALGSMTGSTESGAGEAAAAGAIARPLMGPGGLVGLASRGAEALGARGAAEGLGKAATFLQKGVGEGASLGQKILGGAAQGAGLGAEQLIAPVIGGTVTPKEAAEGVALGGVAGGALPIVAKGAQALARQMGFASRGIKYQPGVATEAEALAAPTVAGVAPAVEDATKLSYDPTKMKLIENVMNELGVSSRDIKMSQGVGLGRAGRITSQGRYAEQAKEDLYKLIERQSKMPGNTWPRNPDELQQLLNSHSDYWDQLIPQAEAKGVTALDSTGALAPEFEALDSVQKLKAASPDTYNSLVKNLNTYGRDVDGAPNLSAERNFLRDEARVGTGEASNAGARAKSDAASDMHELLGEKIGEIDPNWGQLKADYKALQPLKYAQARNMSAISKMESGSPTAARTALGGVLGFSTGATDVAKKIDPNDPSTWGPAAAELAAATVGGSLVGKASAAGYNMARGEVSKMILTAMDNPKIRAAMIRAKPALAKVFSSPQTFIDRAAAMEPSGENISPEATQRVQENMPINVDPVAAPDAAKAAQGEAASSEPQKQQATDQTNEKYQAAIEQRLQAYYNAEYSRFMTYDEFKSQVAAVTDNFNPLKSAKVLFDDPAMQKAYLKDYNTALQLQKINPAGAYEQNKSVSGLFGALDPQKKLKQEGYNNLIDIIAAQVSGTDRLPSPLTVKTVKADIDNIMSLPVSAADKNKRLMSLMSQKYGFGVDTLANLGLI